VQSINFPIASAEFEASIHDLRQSRSGKGEVVTKLASRPVAGRLSGVSGVGTMASFHRATFELLGPEPRTSAAALGELERTEQRLGMRLPPSVREWYSYGGALPILAAHSNNDPPIPVQEFSPTESTAGRLIPIRRENQCVCNWAILLDGSEDPPVLVDVDSDGAVWQPVAEKFSTYVHTCVWDYHVVLHRPALVQAQNEPLSPQALQALQGLFDERPRTFGWPGSAQYRFDGGQHGILIWSTEDQQADWFVGAADANSLELALRLVWNLDAVGESFYDCSRIAEVILTKLKSEGKPSLRRTRPAE
jgi:hypothetical protein